MANEHVDFGRRRAVKLAFASVVAVPLASLARIRPSAAQDLPHLEEDDPAAQGLMYRIDATQAERPEKGGTPGADQFCHNCQFITADSGEWRGCALFPGKAVNENGWCSAWTLKVS
jgi:hypothetical protein